MRVVVAVDGEMTTRAAHSMAAHPGIDEVALFAPSTSSHFDTVGAVEGFDVVVGTHNASVLAAEHDLPAVVTGALGHQPGVSFASVPGLALALGIGLIDVALVAAAIPGEPGGSEQVTFPSPIDTRTAAVEVFGGQEVHVGRGEGDLAAALVEAAVHHRAMVDDHRFMSAVALAAAVAILATETVEEPCPVWSHSGPYLQAAVQMGLVMAERPA